MKEAWLRAAADFDNYRKRVRREVDEARRAGREDLLKAVLPVFDNLERALQHADRTIYGDEFRPWSDSDAAREGLRAAGYTGTHAPMSTGA